MEELVDFCDDPTSDTFNNIAHEIQLMLYNGAQYVLRNDKGDEDISKKISRFYKGSHMSPPQKRGIKALLVGLRLLIRIREETEQIARLKVYTSTQRSPIFSIWYEKDLPLQFFIKQTSKSDINKELLLHLDNAIDYFIDFVWRHNLTINKITIKTDTTKLFYTEDVGVFWGSEDCIKCRKTFKKYGIDCMDRNCDYDLALKKLRKLFLRYHPDKGGDSDIFDLLHQCRERVLDDRCYDNIRHAPE